jgi:hypothetical protein
LQENPASSAWLDLHAFGGFEHDDLARGFGAPHIFSHQVIHAHGLQVANARRRAFFYQRGCAVNDVGVIGARFRGVYDNGVRAGEVLQMEPHGVLGRLFDKRIILGLVCTDLDGVSAIENLGVHLFSFILCCIVNVLNQFLHGLNHNLEVKVRRVIIYACMYIYCTQCQWLMN